MSKKDAFLTRALSLVIDLTILQIKKKQSQIKSDWLNVQFLSNIHNHCSGIINKKV